MTPEERAEKIMDLVDWDWQNWKPNAKELIAVQIREAVDEAKTWWYEEGLKTGYQRFQAEGRPGETINWEDRLRAKSEAYEDAAKIVESFPILHIPVPGAQVIVKHDEGMREMLASSIRARREALS